MSESSIRRSASTSARTDENRTRASQLHVRECIMKTEIKKLAELRLLLNAAVAVLAYDPVLYDVDALLAGRKIALPLIDSALKLSGGVCHREIGLAKSLLGCKRRE